MLLTLSEILHQDMITLNTPLLAPPCAIYLHLYITQSSVLLSLQETGVVQTAL
jgi:hypothetical protein